METNKIIIIYKGGYNQIFDGHISTTGNIDNEIVRYVFVNEQPTWKTLLDENEKLKAELEETTKIKDILTAEKSEMLIREVESEYVNKNNKKSLLEALNISNDIYNNLFTEDYNENQPDVDSLADADHSQDTDQSEPKLSKKQKKKQKKLIKAIKIFLKHLKKDDDYRRAWTDNIAMSFKDNFAWFMDKKSGLVEVDDNDIHDIANDAAKNFINNLIKY